MTRKELMEVIADVVNDSGLESDPEFIQEFASDLADRLDEQFSILDEEEADEEEEEF